MQLKPNLGLNTPGLRRALAAAAAGLLASGHAKAQEAASETTSTTLDAAVLVYREVNRVQAIEPAVNVSHKINEDSSFSFGLIVDSLTGPTPLGAVPSTLSQTYVRPYAIVSTGTTVTTTTASGGSTVVVVPSTSGATTQTLGASTTVPPNSYPLEAFQDRRVAGHFGWQQALTDTLKFDGGVAYSKEHDYRSGSVNVALSRDFNTHNTTVTAGFNYESNSSFPIGGTPTPLTVMSADWKGPGASMHEVDALIGVTQVLSRRWLATLSYSYADARGYQTDPYKIISVVDPVTGQPTQQLYESRPQERVKQSLFFDNRIHLTSDVIFASLRGYRDDWGIKSLTADLRYRWQFGPDFYIEPHVRYYRQGAADFFHYFLVSGEVVPEYASADTRLAAFHAQTYGAKFGLRFDAYNELYLRTEYYIQQGNGYPAGAIGQLKQQDLFPDLRAYTVLLGYTCSF